MKKRQNTFGSILLIVVILIAGCGRKTLPEPYPRYSVQLPVLTGTTVNFQNQDLIFRWQVDSSRVELFRVQLLRRSSCGDCDDELLGMFQIHKAGKVVEWKSDRFQIESHDSVIYHQNDKNFQLTIPSRIYPKALRNQLSHYRINYLSSDKEEVQGVALYPRRPLSIPVPVVLRATWLPAVDGEKKRFMIQWKEQVETTEHRFEEKKRTERVRYYGVNLYIVTAEGVEKKLNPKPLYHGSTLLNKKYEVIFLRHVDRFGNESKKIKL